MQRATKNNINNNHNENYNTKKVPHTQHARHLLMILEGSMAQNTTIRADGAVKGKATKLTWHAIQQNLLWAECHVASCVAAKGLQRQQRHMKCSKGRQKGGKIMSW